jgi:hypothetical protein
LVVVHSRNDSAGFLILSKLNITFSISIALLKLFLVSLPFRLGLGLGLLTTEEVLVSSNRRNNLVYLKVNRKASPVVNLQKEVLARADRFFQVVINRIEQSPAGLPPRNQSIPQAEFD